MKKILFWGLAVAGFAGAAVTLRVLNDAQDARFCTLMERQSEFDGETVDMLWHWKREGRPSERFQRLYEAKIAALPGWRP